MFWQPGEHIYWHYRRPRWSPGDAQYIDPVTVVRDDDRGLVAWLALGTEVLKSVLPDGGHPRSAPPEVAFSIGRVSARGRWQGPGILRIAASGVPWSVWLFWVGGRRTGAVHRGGATSDRGRRARRSADVPGGYVPVRRTVAGLAP